MSTYPSTINYGLVLSSEDETPFGEKYAKADGTALTDVLNLHNKFRLDGVWPFRQFENINQEGNTINLFMKDKDLFHFESIYACGLMIRDERGKEYFVQMGIADPVKRKRHGDWVALKNINDEGYIPFSGKIWVTFGFLDTTGPLAPGVDYLIRGSNTLECYCPPTARGSDNAMKLVNAIKDAVQPWKTIKEKFDSNSF